MSLGAGMIESAADEVDGLPHTVSISIEGKPEVLWLLARRLMESGHPVAVLPSGRLLAGPAGAESAPAAASVELHFTSDDLADNPGSATDRISKNWFVAAWLSKNTETFRAPQP